MYQICIEILQNSNDGDDLSPRDLKLVECGVNGELSEKGELWLHKVLTRCQRGIYKKSWFHNVEHVTNDHEGYVYWKGKQVEHFSYRDGEEEKKAVEEFAQTMMAMEAKGMIINVRTYLKFVK